VLRRAVGGLVFSVHYRAVSFHAPCCAPLLPRFVIQEVGGRGLITTTVKARESFVQPQGLIHFSLNPSCEPAQFIAFFPSTDAGTSLTASDLLSLPDEVLRATIGTEDLSGVEALRKAVAMSPVPASDPVCRKRCGLPA
jgi:hypothetical protein